MQISNKPLFCIKLTTPNHNQLKRNIMKNLLNKNVNTNLARALIITLMVVIFAVGIATVKAIEEAHNTQKAVTSGFNLPVDLDKPALKLDSDMGIKTEWSI